MLNEIACYNTNGIVPTPQGNRHAASAPFQEFATKDGSIMVCCPTNAQFKTLMETLDQPEKIHDLRNRRSVIKTKTNWKLCCNQFFQL